MERSHTGNIAQKIRATFLDPVMKQAACDAVNSLISKGMLPLELDYGFIRNRKGVWCIWLRGWQGNIAYSEITEIIAASRGPSELPEGTIEDLN